MEHKAVKTAVVGTGKISGIYLQQMTEVFDILDVVAVADLNREAAEAQAEAYKIPNVSSVDEVLADPEIEIVVNLTIPAAHHEIAKAAIEAGKSVHNEKPLTVSRDEGRELLELAKDNKVLLGSAPDTFLGAGHQTCRKLIDDGWIGDAIGCTAFMLGHGHESWHPSPEFYYQPGGGPMFDMGPYYLTALVQLLGPVQSVAGSAIKGFETRTITSQPKCGKVVEVEVPTHVTGILNFANGASGTICTSFDVWGHHHSPIEIYGTEGSLFVPDPNGFGGNVGVRLPQNDEQQIPLTHQYPQNSRGVGVADMAYALREGRTNRCSGELAFHVLDIMHAIHDAAREQRTVILESSCTRPDPMPRGGIS